MQQPVNDVVKKLLTEKLMQLEAHFEADFWVYHGALVNGLENQMLSVLEDIAYDATKRNKLFVVLTTNGGSATVVERYVNVIRKHYDEINFIVPDYAYSAGTIFCMSGDNLYMDYFSVLGPIDPQVQNKEGKWVAALGYLDKINEMLIKAQNDTLTNAEFVILREFDLAELRDYEQAKELTIDLLQKWLVTYKFKDWHTHQSNPQLIGQPVTWEQKEQRAKEIADKLSDNNIWKSHGRPIDIQTLKALKLEVIDYSNLIPERTLIRDYYTLLADYAKDMSIFVQTRKFI